MNDEEENETIDCPVCRDDLILRVISRNYSEQLCIGFIKYVHECPTCGFRTAPFEEEV